MPTFNSLLACLIVALMGFAPGFALAAPADEAESLVKRGIELRKEFKDQEALEQFQRAYDLVREPRIQAQIGVAEQALGRWIDAEVHVSGALSAKSDVWISKNRSALEEALASIRTHLGHLEVIVSPKGSEVRIDGRQVGQAPFTAPLRVREGSAVIEFRAPGYFPATRTVVIRAEELTRETVSLQPTSSAGSASRASARGQTVGSDVGSEASPGTPAPTTPTGQSDGDHPSDGSGSWKRPVAWALAGGALVFTGGAIAALVVRNDRAKSYNKLVDSGDCPGAMDATCNELRSDGSFAATVAGVGFGIAGAMAVTSVILLATAPSRSDHSAVALSGCTLTRNARGVACSFSF